MDFAAVFFDFFLRVLRVALFLGEVIDQAFGALHGVEDGDRATDARVAACDESFLAFELAGGFVDLVAPVFGGDLLGLRVGAFHVRLTAGL